MSDTCDEMKNVQTAFDFQSIPMYPHFYMHKRLHPTTFSKIIPNLSRITKPMKGIVFINLNTFTLVNHLPSTQYVNEIEKGFRNIL